MTYILWTRAMPIGAAAMMGGMLYFSFGPRLLEEVGLVSLMQREILLPAAEPERLEIEPKQEAAADTVEDPAPDPEVATEPVEVAEPSAAESQDCPSEELNTVALANADVVLEAAAPEPTLTITRAALEGISEPDSAPVSEPGLEPEQPQVTAAPTSGTVTWSYITPSSSEVRALLQSGRLSLRVHLSDGRQMVFLPGPRDDLFWSQGRFLPDPGNLGTPRLSEGSTLVPKAQIRARVVAARLGATFADVSLMVAPEEANRLRGVIDTALAGSGAAPGADATAYGCWRPHGFALAALSVDGTRHDVRPGACPTP